MWPFLLLPAILLISGCIALPGLESIIPFFGPPAPGYEDVIGIKEITTLPTQVSAEQTLKLIVAVQNAGSKEMEDVSVKLYDTCDLFEFDVSKPEQRISLLPKEIQEVSWQLRAKTVLLRTSCDLKVSINYPFTTETLTTVTFINFAEYQRRLGAGTFKPVTSTILYGEGPVKAWFEVKDAQPIPVDKEVDVSLVLNVENRGGGGVPGSEIVREGNFTLEPQGKFEGKCKDFSSARFIGRRAPPIPCTYAFTGEVSAELTEQLIVKVDYLYEIGASTRVTVVPK